MRTYIANAGMLPALETRFRDHTIKFFKKYSMTSIGYWMPIEGPMAETHADLHPRPPEPRGGQGELGIVLGGQGMAEGQDGLRSQRAHSREGA